jgi:hypothetical protein
MPPTNYDGFSVHTDALLDEAKVWEDEALAIENVGKNVGSLKFSKTGVFEEFIPKYDTLITAILDRCSEGTRNMADIRDTLHYIAQVYERTEARHSHDFQSVLQK